MSSIFQRQTTCLAVFERQPFWGPELQRQFADQPILVRECRSLRDLAPALQNISHGAVLLDFDAAPAEALRWLALQFIHSSSVARIVVASREFAEFEGLIRESDAIFVDDEVPRISLARLCRRHLSPMKTPLVAAVRVE